MNLLRLVLALVEPFIEIKAPPPPPPSDHPQSVGPRNLSKRKDAPNLDAKLAPILSAVMDLTRSLNEVKGELKEVVPSLLPPISHAPVICPSPPPLQPLLDEQQRIIDLLQELQKEKKLLSVDDAEKSKQELTEIKNMLATLLAAKPTPEPVVVVPAAIAEAPSPPAPPSEPENEDKKKQPSDAAVTQEIRIQALRDEEQRILRIIKEKNDLQKRLLEEISLLETKTEKEIQGYRAAQERCRKEQKMEHDMRRRLEAATTSFADLVQGESYDLQSLSDLLIRISKKTGPFNEQDNAQPYIPSATTELQNLVKRQYKNKHGQEAGVDVGISEMINVFTLIPAAANTSLEFYPTEEAILELERLRQWAQLLIAMNPDKFESNVLFLD